MLSVMSILIIVLICAGFVSAADDDSEDVLNAPCDDVSEMWEVNASEGWKKI